jgi:transposase
MSKDGHQLHTIISNKEEMQMITFGIDVSKGESTVAAISPQETLIQPFKVEHTPKDFNDLVECIKSYPNEVRVVMESTGRYHEALLNHLCNNDIFVCVLNPIIAHNYDNFSLRKIHSDNYDPIKLANLGIEKWNKLERSFPGDEVYSSLKDLNRQIQHYNKELVASKNNLTSFLDVVYPGVEKFFTSGVREDGSQKWMVFNLTFWHCSCVSDMTETDFVEKYLKWCKENKYRFSKVKAEKIYHDTCKMVFSKPKNGTNEIIVKAALNHLMSLQKTIQDLKAEMLRLAKTLKEFEVVIAMHGVGDTLAPKLIAEIGDVRRFKSKSKLVAYAGIDPPQYQSGKFESKNRKMSKRGSPYLRQALFLVMHSILENKHADEIMYLYLDKKRSEGKHYLVYMMAGSRKFLNIYYAKLKEFYSHSTEDDS